MNQIIEISSLFYGSPYWLHTGINWEVLKNDWAPPFFPFPSLFTQSVSHSVVSDSLWPPTRTVAHQAPLVHGISQARILKGVAIPFSRGSFWPSNRAQICIAGRFFIILATREAQLLCHFRTNFHFSLPLGNICSPQGQCWTIDRYPGFPANGIVANDGPLHAPKWSISLEECYFYVKTLMSWCLILILV